jgi:ring-1,2-phenylacetyl-CoA epoxidase subunit PaaD
LIENGYQKIKITSVLSPAWTTDWITEKGKQQLKEYGIAPPKGNANSIVKDGIECPQCNSTNTSIISEFGSTACKALYKCEDCKEPFDYFKCY